MRMGRPIRVYSYGDAHTRMGQHFVPYEYQLIIAFIRVAICHYTDFDLPAAAGLMLHL